jgi:putative FmdB family regulatory protein
LPTYDYQCRSCGLITEVVHSMLEDGPTACERCGGALRRVVHPTGIIFKGSGFYKTDSRKAGSGTIAGGSRPTTTAADSGTSAPASPSTAEGSPGGSASGDAPSKSPPAGD